MSCAYFYFLDIRRNPRPQKFARWSRMIQAGDGNSDRETWVSKTRNASQGVPNAFTKSDPVWDPIAGEAFP